MKQIRLLLVLASISLLLFCSKDGNNGTGPSGSYINYVPTGITFTPASLKAGENLTISEFKVANNGLISNDTVTVSISFYLSADGAITTNDILLGTVQITGLKSAETHTGGPQTFTVPTSTANGTYYVGVYVDPNDEVTEGVETDNARAATATLTVTDGGTGGNVNYQALSISYTPASVAAGASINISQYQLKNAGTEDDQSLTVAVGFYLSTDNTITTADILLTSININGLTAGETHTASQNNLTVPSGTTAGAYYVGMYVDNNNQVTETSETDNGISSTTPLTVTGGSSSGVNYVVTAVEFSPASVYQYDMLDYTNYTVANNGNAGSNKQITVGFYLSTDNVITTSGDDIRLGTVTISGLGAGETHSGTRSFSIGGHIMPGTYYVGVYADSDNAAAESDETDNGGVATTTLTVSQ